MTIEYAADLTPVGKKKIRKIGGAIGMLTGVQNDVSRRRGMSSVRTLERGDASKAGALRCKRGGGEKERLTSITKHRGK